MWLSDQPAAEATYGLIKDWDVSEVTDMSKLFYNAQSFNDAIGLRDTSSVTRIDLMFREASSFNNNIGLWDTSAVVMMKYMFFKASSFNQPLGDWNVANVYLFHHMFYLAVSFNQDISRWDVTTPRQSTLNMMSFLTDVEAFNRDLSGWCLDDSVGTAYMFAGYAHGPPQCSGWGMGDQGPPSGATSCGVTFNGC